jgi:NADPH:quinone reductase-like Zn-dependent oxidoreductase
MQLSYFIPLSFNNTLLFIVTSTQESNMQAIELRQFGLDNLAHVAQEKPQPGPGEVLMRIRAASLNYRDRVLIDGSYMPNLRFPLVPVSDGAGEVVAIGQGGQAVPRWKVGDRVTTHYTTSWLAGEMTEAHQAAKLGGPLQGMLREYAVLPESALVATPAHLSDAEAATLPIAALTAWNALQDANLRAGQTVLLQGTGGVSLFALQFAKVIGARVIITSSSDAKLGRAIALGAHHGINYRDTPNWGEAARALNGGRGIDVVVEVGGAHTLAQSLTAIRQCGTIAVIGFLGGLGAGPDVVRALVQKRARMLGISVGHRESFEAMNRVIELHKIKPIIDRSFPLTQTADAFRHFGSSDLFGKVVISI